MDYLHLNFSLQDVPNKAQYLLKAAQRWNLPVRSYMDTVSRGEIPDDFVLNVQPYKNGFHEGKKWTGTWEIDCLIHRDTLGKEWFKCDTVFLANDVKWLKPSSKFYLLYQACDPTYYNKLMKRKKDFVYIGNFSDLYYYRDFGYEDGPLHDDADVYGERKRCINLLQKEVLKRRHTLFLLNTAAHLEGSRMKIKDYLRKSSEGRVMFIHSMLVHGEGELGQRFFEMLPIGPVLTNYVPELANLDLVEDVDYMAYRDDEEMVYKFNKLVEDAGLRDRIAISGSKKAYAAHTYGHRLKEILKYLKENYGFQDR